MREITNAYTLNPGRVKSGQVSLYTVKIMLDRWGDGNLYYSLYRCAHPATPNQTALTDSHGIPQGDKIHDTKENLKAVVNALFPAYVRAGAEPAPDTVIGS